MLSAVASHLGRGGVHAVRVSNFSPAPRLPPLADPVGLVPRSFAPPAGAGGVGPPGKRAGPGKMKNLEEKDES